MIPPIPALVAANALPRATCKPFDHCGAKGAVTRAFKHSLRTVGVGPGLIADHLEASYPLLERRVVQIGNTGLDGIVEALETRLRFGRLPL
ncbi:hypothetical protein [Haematobacter missouriensis]|uniref:hypothetical protein n=1 Tax=Haematobacter missouriensis TaxID=366616 RepID=UPI001E64A5BF|nr:hypothetical protein [Haematobacter missouriensis]